MMNTSLQCARSFLFVPGHHTNRYAKALASGSDAVIIDLEDAVAPANKPEARAAILTAWAALTASERERLLVRINAAGDIHEHSSDLTLLSSLVGLGAVVLPKTESAAEVNALARACPGLPILPMLESAEGLAQLDAIAQANQVLRLGLGHVDLQADLGMVCGQDEAELGPVRCAMVVATRRARLACAVDGVTTSTSDAAAVLHDTLRSRRFGFGGKLCIHPAQIPAVHQGMAPTEVEIAWANQVLDASAQAGGGAIRVDGKMVDAPVVALARRTLRRMPSRVQSVHSTL